MALQLGAALGRFGGLKGAHFLTMEPQSFTGTHILTDVMDAVTLEPPRTWPLELEAGDWVLSATLVNDGASATSRSIGIRTPQGDHLVQGTGSGSFGERLTFTIPADTTAEIIATAHSGTRTLSFGDQITLHRQDLEPLPASPIQFIGSTTASGNTITIPAHQAGDLIVMCTRGSGTAPSGWTNHVTRSGSWTGGRIGWRIAPSAGTVSGTWNGANQMVCAVYRGATGLGAFNSAGDVTFPYLTMQQPNSWAVRMAVTRYDHTHTNPPNPPNTVRGHQVSLTVWDSGGVQGRRVFEGATTSNSYDEVHLLMAEILAV